MMIGCRFAIDHKHTLCLTLYSTTRIVQNIFATYTFRSDIKAYQEILTEQNSFVQGT